MSAVVQSEIGAALRFAAQVAMLFPGTGAIVGPLLQLAPEAVSLVSAIMNMAQGNRGPTPEELAQLDALIEANSAKIHAAADRARAQLAAQP